MEIIDEAEVEKTKLTCNINPDEAPAVKLAFYIHNESKVIKIVADALIKQGYRSPHGAPKNKDTVGEWFRNPYPFAGCMVWNTRNHELKLQPKSEWVIVEEAYPAVISMDVAEKVYEKSEARRLDKPPKHLIIARCLACSNVARVAQILPSTAY